MVSPGSMGEGKVYVRSMIPGDAQVIPTISLSFETQWVWQMEYKASDEGVSTLFRPVRLPRALKVDPPVDWKWLADWQKRELVLVAVAVKDVVGYLELGIGWEKGQGWVNHMAVQGLLRRRGIASLLIAEAKRWAKKRQLVGLMAETQTKNYPAIRLFQKCGFRFCGFNDHLYPTKEIALFFSQDLV
ncbi:MAG: GNAT family N-acetyltransferase [Chloroflexi bacterium]|nr:GNAT family N-acetyltransferase [Chloroflexota bacterium]